MVGQSMSKGLCLVCACALQVLKGIMTDEIKEKVGASLLLLKGNLILAMYIDKLNKSHNPWTVFT